MAPKRKEPRTPGLSEVGSELILKSALLLQDTSGGSPPVVHSSLKLFEAVCGSIFTVVIFTVKAVRNMKAYHCHSLK